MTSRRLWMMVALSVLVCGCNQNKATPEWAGGGPGKDQAGNAGAPATVPSAKSVRISSVIVRQESNHNPIAADIFRQGDSTLFVSVGDSGEATLDKTCTSSDMFIVTPRVAAYLQIEPIPCSPTLDFELPSANTTYALVVQGDDAFKAGNFAAAQHYYTIAADRFAVSQPGLSSNLRSKANVAAGRALQIVNPTVQLNGNERLSVETQNKLKELQSRKGLPVTGALDEATSGKLSGMSKQDAIKNAQAVSPARIQEISRIAVSPGS